MSVRKGGQFFMDLLTRSHGAAEQGTVVQRRRPARATVQRSPGTPRIPAAPPGGMWGGRAGGNRCLTSRLLPPYLAIRESPQTNTIHLLRSRKLVYSLGFGEGNDRLKTQCLSRGREVWVPSWSLLALPSPCPSEDVLEMPCFTQVLRYLWRSIAL